MSKSTFFHYVFSIYFDDITLEVIQVFSLTLFSLCIKDLRQLSFLKQQQQQHILKASQKGASSSTKKPPTASTSSSSAKDDGMSTISTMSTTSNMSTSSSEVEHANMSRAINRQRSASGGKGYEDMIV